MVTFLRTLFHWPDGIVVGNLIASAMWAIPSLIHLHRKLDRHHAELKEAMSASGNDNSSTHDRN